LPWGVADGDEAVWEGEREAGTMGEERRRRRRDMMVV
jgi:hypothetical protein